MSEIKKYKKEIIEFIDFLLQLAQNERLMDVNRCLLAQDLYFDVSSLYSYIFFKYSDEKNISQNILTFSTFKKFIEEDLEIKITDEILLKIFDFYSITNFYEGERYLDYLEFSDIFYPRYNLKLRKYLQQRIGLNKEIKALNDITKKLLKKLFIRQINMVKYLIHYNDIMKIDCLELFNIISNNNIFLTKKDLINLFNKENIFYTKEDINSIMTSLSFNNKFFYSNKNANIEEGIYYQSFENIFNIPKKIFSIKPLTNIDKISIMKSIILNSIYQEKKIEEAKILIVNREDFDFNILLKLFLNGNNDNKNEIIEFTFFLNKLNLSLDEIEQELLLRRIDLLRKRYLYKSDLFDFFIPFDKEYRDKINNDLKNNIYNNKNSKKTFSKGTMIFINNLINVVVKGEKEINNKKMKLNNDIEFVENIFNEICKMSKDNNDGEKKENDFHDYFNSEQLFKYFKEQLNMEISENEMYLFFIRLDKLRRGRIEILEFSDEMKNIP